jgi:pimeloyl-ACP methyl ester carboxylesterase
MACGTWNAAAAASLSCPAFLIGGDQDRTSGYLRGVRRLFSCGPAPVPRFLLTYRGGTHNDVVPFPSPVAAQEINLPDFLPACAALHDSNCDGL